MKTLLTVKDGVELGRLHPVLRAKIFPMALIWCAHFPEDVDGMTITSGHEGHSGDGIHKRTSLHYVGRAVDLRNRDVKRLRQGEFLVGLKQFLGPDFDCLLKKDHFHVEYDPKGPGALVQEEGYQALADALHRRTDPGAESDPGWVDA